jgi:phosphatidylserine/phosphatidylglycerophosphate/cardiolipin synthase-like enzyme
MLDWYASKIENAKQTVMFTAAFGVNKKFAEKFAVNENFLRFVLMEKPSSSKEVQEMMRKDADVQIALGQKLNTTILKHKFEGWQLDKWFKEEDHYRKKGMIFYVHTKYLMIDALTDDPIIFTGSANFSSNSLLSNDENMILIRGDKRVADIYLTEFMRLFRHFYFRDFMRRMIDENIPVSDKPGFLEEDPKKWQEKHFTVWKFNSKRRELFKG